MTYASKSLLSIVKSVYKGERSESDAFININAVLISRKVNVRV